MFGETRRRLTTRLRSRNERGSVAIEAAFIFPILILILFGIIEFSPLSQDHVALSAAVRSGARTASAEPRMSTFSTDAASAVLKAGTGMPFSNVQEMWVYEANAGGYPTNGGSISATTGSFTSCTTRCLVFHHANGAFHRTPDHGVRRSSTRALVMRHDKCRRLHQGTTSICFGPVWQWGRHHRSRGASIRADSCVPAPAIRPMQVAAHGTGRMSR